MDKEIELETINKLFLELSQIVTAKTKREIKLENKIVHLEEEIGKILRDNE